MYRKDILGKKIVYKLTKHGFAAMNQSQKDNL